MYLVPSRSSEQAHMTEPTLTQALARIGLTVESTGPYPGQRYVTDPAGDVVFAGTASDAWAWLRSQPPHLWETAHDPTVAPLT